MLAIIVNPDDKSIKYEEVSKGQLDELFGGVSAPHWIIPHCLPENIGYVDPKGLVDGKTQWFFCGVHIWGPLVILGDSDNDVQCTLEEVERHTHFKWPR